MFLLKAVFLGFDTRTRPSTGFNKKIFSSDQCTLCLDLTFHPIWSRAHLNLYVLWRFVSKGCFIGLLAWSLALLWRLLTVRLLMCPLTIHRLRSVFAVLNGCCIANLVKSLSCGSFQKPSYPLPFFSTPGVVHALHYIESFSSLSVWYTTPYHSIRLPSLCIWLFSTCHFEIKFRKFQVLPILHVQILIINPRQTWDW